LGTICDFDIAICNKTGRPKLLIAGKMMREQSMSCLYRNACAYTDSCCNLNMFPGLPDRVSTAWITGHRETANLFGRLGQDGHQHINCLSHYSGCNEYHLYLPSNIWFSVVVGPQLGAQALRHHGR
jgi:hypothetical protein